MHTRFKIEVKIVEILTALLAIVDNSDVQSSAQTFIHNAIFFTDTSNNAWHNEVHWLIGTPYLLTIASNDLNWKWKWGSENIWPS